MAAGPAVPPRPLHAGSADGAARGGPRSRAHLGNRPAPRRTHHRAAPEGGARPSHCARRGGAGASPSLHAQPEVAPPHNGWWNSPGECPGSVTATGACARRAVLAATGAGSGAELRLCGFESPPQRVVTGRTTGGLCVAPAFPNLSVVTPLSPTGAPKPFLRVGVPRRNGAQPRRTALTCAWAPVRHAAFGDPNPGLFLSFISVLSSWSYFLVHIPRPISAIAVI